MDIEGVNQRQELDDLFKHLRERAPIAWHSRSSEDVYTRVKYGVWYRNIQRKQGAAMAIQAAAWDWRDKDISGALKLLEVADELHDHEDGLVNELRGRLMLYCCDRSKHSECRTAIRWLETAYQLYSKSKMHQQCLDVRMFLDGVYHALGKHAHTVIRSPTVANRAAMV
jgi:hypothetical protein